MYCDLTTGVVYPLLKRDLLLCTERHPAQTVATNLEFTVLFCRGTS